MPDLKIAHLYAQRMNIYGDRGNIMTFVRRAGWRDISTRVDACEVGDSFDLEKYDLFFFGGGQDQEQERVADDLQHRAAGLKEAVENGAALLAVCGGYQLLGDYYQPADAARLEGAGLFPLHTEAGSKRLIGNVVAQSDYAGLDTLPLVGFENHSGLTYLDEGGRPLAKVTSGSGNNGQDGFEGCVYRRAIGTYLHGSLLPKNPHLADWLLEAALQRRFPDYSLEALPDAAERQANQAVAGRFS